MHQTSNRIYGVQAQLANHKGGWLAMIRMERVCMKTFFTIAFAGMGLAIFIALCFGLPFMLTWNHAIVPAVDGTNPIGFFQAFAIAFMTAMLCKGTEGSAK